MIEQGAVYWIDLGVRRGSAPAGRRPVMVVQADEVNASRLATAVIAAISSNLELARFPGNVLVAASESGLPRDSVVNVTQIRTIDKADLSDYAGTVSTEIVRDVLNGLRQVLGL